MYGWRITGSAQISYTRSHFKLFSLNFCVLIVVLWYCLPNPASKCTIVKKRLPSASTHTNSLSCDSSVTVRRMYCGVLWCDCILLFGSVTGSNAIALFCQQSSDKKYTNRLLSAKNSGSVVAKGSPSCTTTCWCCFINVGRILMSMKKAHLHPKLILSSNRKWPCWATTLMSTEFQQQIIKQALGLRGGQDAKLDKILNRYCFNIVGWKSSDKKHETSMSLPLLSTRTVHYNYHHAGAVVSIL